jgi:hypothetical protein
MATYGGLGKRSIHGEIEPMAPAPPKRPVNPAGGLTRTITGHQVTANREAPTGGSAASLVSGSGGILPQPQQAPPTIPPPQESYGPSFRDVQHQEQVGRRDDYQAQQEAMFGDQGPQQNLIPEMGYQPSQDPTYAGRDARFLAADIDVAPPGRPAGLDTREMATNLPPQTPNPFGMGTPGARGTGGVEVPGTIPNYLDIDAPGQPPPGQPVIPQEQAVQPPPPPTGPPPVEPPPPVQTPPPVGTQPPVNGVVNPPVGQPPVQPPVQPPTPLAQPPMQFSQQPQIGAAPQMAGAQQSVMQQATPQQQVPRDRPGSTAPSVQPAPQPAAATPQYQVPQAPAPQQPGVDVSTAQPQAQVTKPGDMPPETSNVLQRNMEGLAESENTLDTSLHNVLSQVLEQGTDIDAEALVPRLKSERERLSSFRDTAKRGLLADLARRGFQLGGAQEAAVLAELEREITTATAQSFRDIVNDERTRADQRLSQGMQIAASQQQQAQQLGLSREQLGVEARLGLGQEQLQAGQLGLAGEELGLRARTAYGQERLGQEQLAVQQRTAQGQEALGYGQLGLGQETLGVQERAGFAQQQQAQAQLAAQQRSDLGREALGFAGLDVQQGLGMEQARLREQELRVQENLGLGRLDVDRFGAETGRLAAGTQQYGQETARMASQNDAVLRDLELSDKFQQFTMKMGFDTAAFEASMRLAEQGQTNELLGILNNYLNVLGQGEMA